MSHDSKKAMPKQGQICWTELTTHNATKAKEFYSKLFGWNFMENPAEEFKGYNSFKLGEGDEMGGVMQIPSEGEYAQMPTRWLSYIYVDDIEAKIKEAEGLGAKVKVPVTNVSDFGRFSVLLDPTGAEIAFWQSLKNR
jgi:predicted enzyme related to lactoylglutathione lyase